MEHRDTESFVVKVWLEETVEEAGRATWRGHVTHVASGERRYLESLTGVGTFIRPYLERWGVQFSFFDGLRDLVVERLRSRRTPKRSAPRGPLL